MIYELAPNEFKNLLPLNHYYNLEIPAILSGYNTGRVFADSKTQPSTALIWTDDGGFFIGDSSNQHFFEDLNSFMGSIVKPLRAKRDATNWYICSVSSEWDQKLEDFFGQEGLTHSLQYVYRVADLDALDTELPELAPELSMEPASVEFLQRPYQNLDYFVSDILTFWPDIETFCKKGFGYFLTKGDEILSRCSLDFRYKNITTIGVATDANHRRQGYAGLTVQAVLHHCKKMGYSPYWDCMATNTGSIALATSKGFHRDYTYSVYEINLSSF